MVQHLGAISENSAIFKCIQILLLLHIILSTVIDSLIARRLQEKFSLQLVLLCLSQLREATLNLLVLISRQM